MTKKQLTLSLGLCLVMPVTFAASEKGHESVSSDGMPVPRAFMDSSEMNGVSGSKGYVEPGHARDELAEFPAEVASQAQMAELRKYKALVPSYAKGEAVSESVIGVDSRYRIYPSQSGHPERAIGLITFKQGSGSYICTGWMIGKDTVATAGHCVHSGGSSGVWSTDVLFYPGRDAASSPYGSCSAKRLYSVSGWTSNKSANYDYGAIKLNCSIGNTTGWFGFFWQTASLTGLPVQVSGYPGDKPSGTHWSGSGDIEVSETYKTRYKIDTAGGQSGGPVFQTDREGSYCTGPCVNTIHAYGLSAGRNSGTRIRQAVYNNLINWRNAP